MTKAEFETWATKSGFSRDRWGHFHKGETRLKVSSTTVRLEVKATAAGWVRLRSNYFSKLSLTADGKLSGLKY